MVVISFVFGLQIINEFEKRFSEINDQPGENGAYHPPFHPAYLLDLVRKGLETK